MPFRRRQQGGNEGGFVRQEGEEEEEGIFHGSTHRQKRQTEKKERKEGVEILIHGAEQGDFFTAQPPTELGLVMLAQLACELDE